MTDAGITQCPCQSQPLDETWVGAKRVVIPFPSDLSFQQFVIHRNSEVGAETGGFIHVRSMYVILGVALLIREVSLDFFNSILSSYHHVKPGHRSDAMGNIGRRTDINAGHFRQHDPSIPGTRRRRRGSCRSRFER